MGIMFQYCYFFYDGEGGYLFSIFCLLFFECCFGEGILMFFYFWVIFVCRWGSFQGVKEVIRQRRGEVQVVGGEVRWVEGIRGEVLIGFVVVLEVGSRRVFFEVYGCLSFIFIRLFRGRVYERRLLRFLVFLFGFRIKSSCVFFEYLICL